MSALLDTLLDAERRAECDRNDEAPVRWLGLHEEIPACYLVGAFTAPPVIDPHVTA